MHIPITGIKKYKTDKFCKLTGVVFSEENDMKKAKGKLLFSSALTAAGALLGLNACMYGPPELPSTDVYGPPEYFEGDEPDEPMQTDYGPPVITYDDKDEPGPEVYGPPEDFDMGEDEEPIVTVYGPPEWFSHSEEDDIDMPVTPVYGPPEDYEEIDEPMEDVYGPPEDFTGEK